MTGLSTRAVHGAGGGRAGVTGPIERSATFHLDAAGLADLEATGGANTWYYSRLANPTVTGAARAVAALEGAETALLFASGMAAIDTALTALVRPGGRLVAAKELYGDTIALLRAEWAAAGRTVRFVDVGDLSAVRAALEGSDALLVEAISNPMLRVADLPALAQAARSAGALSIVDATMASPANVRPLEHGFDLVLHSATKYLNGHAAVTAGAAAGGAQLTAGIKALAVLRGTTLDPAAAFLLERGLKTLPLRIERHNANGLTVATWLAARPDVAEVSYPGLERHPEHALAGTLLAGYGGMVTLTLAGEPDRARQVLGRLGVLAHAASLGGVESLACLPSLTSHSALTDDERAHLGITPNTIRLSLGIEDAVDLIADLEQALAV